ncbi:MAG: phage major capsid protein [Desulfurellales bacterium]|nr:MAG: phage major capsid protein [Desulfurellales bacterium]
MASPNSNFSEIVTTTLRHRSKKLKDNMSKNIALLMRLQEKDNIEEVSGGRTIVEELDYAENSTFMYYDGDEQLNISASDVMTAAEFDWKQAVVAVRINGKELAMNNGPDQIIDLLASRVKNAEKTMLNNLSSGVYSDGTGTSGKQIGGLQSLVSDAGTGTVGGIDSSTYTFWQNAIYDFSSNSLAASASTIQDAMNSLYLNLCRNRDRPDLIIADNTYFGYYWKSLQAIQRISDDKVASAGFRSLKFMDSDVVFDGGFSGTAPSAHMYFLNTDYVKFRPHKNRNMVPLNPDRFATNQDALVKLIGWMGNMTISNRSLNGVIVA